MFIYTIVSNYCDGKLFGSYTTIKRARMALESMAKESADIAYCEDVGDYCYSIVTYTGDCYSAEIIADELDFEFEHGFLTDN